MQVWASTEKSITSLVRQLGNAAKNALKEEFDLAKAELAEKVARYGRRSAVLTAGGLLAYVGLISFLLGLGFLLSFVFRRAGMDDMLAAFAGLGIMGVAAIAIGGALVLVSIKKLKQESLVPEKTITEAKQLKSEVTGQPIQAPNRELAPEPEQTTEEAQADVRRVRHQIGDTLHELRQRLTLKSLGREALNQVKTHPVEAALVGAGAGVAGFLVVRERMHSKRARRSRPLWRSHFTPPEHKNGKLDKILTVIKILGVINAARHAMVAHPPQTGATSSRTQVPVYH
jgi:hypothetical protein